MFDQPQVQINQMVIALEHPEAGKLRMTGVPLRFSETPRRDPTSAPRLGQHTQEILATLGYNSQEIDQLRQKGVIF